MVLAGSCGDEFIKFIASEAVDRINLVRFVHEVRRWGPSLHSHDDQGFNNLIRGYYNPLPAVRDYRYNIGGHLIINDFDRHRKASEHEHGDLARGKCPGRDLAGAQLGHADADQG